MTALFLAAALCATAEKVETDGASRSRSPANDSFWTCPDEPWTSVKAWSGESFPKDRKWPINPQPLYWE